MPVWCDVVTPCRATSASWWCDLHNSPWDGKRPASEPWCDYVQSLLVRQERVVRQLLDFFEDDDE